MLSLPGSQNPAIEIENRHAVVDASLSLSERSLMSNNQVLSAGYPSTHPHTQLHPF